MNEIQQAILILLVVFGHYRLLVDGYREGKKKASAEPLRQIATPVATNRNLVPYYLDSKFIKLLDISKENKQ